MLCSTSRWCTRIGKKHQKLQVQDCGVRYLKLGWEQGYLNLITVCYLTILVNLRVMHRRLKVSRWASGSLQWMTEFVDDQQNMVIQPKEREHQVVQASDQNKQKNWTTKGGSKNGLMQGWEWDDLRTRIDIKCKERPALSPSLIP